VKSDTPPPFIKGIIDKVEKERKEFASLAAFDTLSARLPDKIVGRQTEIEKLVRYLWGYHDGHVVPLVSVYGRSGTGKSTLIKYVCNHTPDIKMCYANLRKAKTIFGCANLILNALDQPSLKSAQGINVAMEKIQQGIFDSMGFNKLFVLVLDEFDVLFYDKRSNPSDFVYKLIEMQAELIEKRCLTMIITISNNVLAEYDLDDRIRSRIGNSEIFFKPYSKDEVLKILEHRAQEAFGKKLDRKVLDKCAYLSFLEHGDARRAVDLLRTAAELALKEKKELTTRYIDLASLQLQKDRVEDVLKTMSYHSKIACFAIAARTFGLDREWHKTSEMYNSYKLYLQTYPVSYRRFSELLTDLENSGLLDSQTGSSGRKGYNSKYRLLVQPEIVGHAIDEKYWDEEIISKKSPMDSFAGIENQSTSDPIDKILKMARDANEKSW